ncbi:LysE family translocator [Massilia sp. 9I]|uniref:LysE family translocator n=1 Tax=Massilia sp. 9I TaxID=2653152 RepID=UPI0012EF0878|nr:LysE family transporter [Massilia sp. 9I]VXC48236.1 L-lysine permease [Massilia sp. 9I]
MSQASALLATLAGIYLAACISPGPNWFLIGELAVSQRRREAVQVALGIAAGSTTWATLSITGVATVLARYPEFGFAWRALGAAYLMWCGMSMLRRAGVPSFGPAAGRESASGMHRHPFRTGLSASLSNPKAGLFWTGVFAANVPGQAPVWLAVGIVAMIAAMSSIFHVGLARMFQAEALQAGYHRYGAWIRSFSGMFLTMIGFRLILLP